jgi:iron complex outermembrane receptor protein
LAQVEVLRGPQGTLYGASSMGGLLKFTTVDPSTDGVSGSVQAGANFVHNGNEAGYSARGSINLPLSDALAMRASAFVRRDPGYVNDLVQHIDGINWGDAYGGRLSALWRPLDNVSLKLSALFQDTKTHGSSDADPTLGDLQQQELPGSGGYEKKFQVYNATLTAKFGSFDLTSLTGYTVNRVKDSFDYTPVFGFADQFLYPAAGVSGSLFLNNNRTTKVSEEVRISTKLGDHVDWLVGGFYTHEDSQWSQDILAANQNSGAVVGPIYYSPFPTTFSEYAGFTDLTFHITHQFDVQIGARESFNTQTYRETIYGPYTVFLGYNGLPIINPEIESKANSFTYLFTPQLKLSDDMMAYARLASGYRPAGINALSNILGTPPSDKPDKTYNYEIGVKGAVLEHRLSFDASVYYIDWKDIQLELALKGTGYGGNASRAKSEGIELSTEVRPFTGLTVSTWMAYNNAVLTAPIPPNPSAVGDSGDRLPFSSRFSGNVSLEQNFPLGDALTGFIGGTESYASNRIGVFTSTSARQTYPAYAKTDFRAGLRYDAWELHLFANNVTDRRGELTGGLGTLHTADFTYIQPRTVGFLASKRF